MTTVRLVIETEENSAILRDSPVVWRSLKTDPPTESDSLDAHVLLKTMQGIITTIRYDAFAEVNSNKIPEDWMWTTYPTFFT